MLKATESKKELICSIFVPKEVRFLNWFGSGSFDPWCFLFLFPPIEPIELQLVPSNQNNLIWFLNWFPSGPPKKDS